MKIKQLRFGITGMSLLVSVGNIAAPILPQAPSYPNIILIQVDQMRPDHLNKMPELMKLANDGVRSEGNE